MRFCARLKGQFLQIGARVKIAGLNRKMAIQLARYSYLIKYRGSSAAFLLSSRGMSFKDI